MTHFEETKKTQISPWFLSFFVERPVIFLAGKEESIPKVWCYIGGRGLLLGVIFWPVWLLASYLGNHGRMWMLTSVRGFAFSLVGCYMCGLLWAFVLWSRLYGEDYAAAHANDSRGVTDEHSGSTAA